MGKHKFKPNQWIVFDIGDIELVGRTWVGPGGEELVSCVASDGNTGAIEWNKIENPRWLSIMKKSEIEQSQKPQQSPDEFDGTHKPIMLSWLIGEC